MSNELTTMTAETLLAMGIAHYDQCENAQQQAVVNAAKSGMYFLEAKAKMKHGEFMPKIAQLRADISHSKINKYMQLSKDMPEFLNSETFPNLKIGQAIALMSAPDELKAEISERIDNGEEISSREIQRLKKEAADLLAEKQSLERAKDNYFQMFQAADSLKKEAEAKVRFQTLTVESVTKQNDELRNRDQALIDAKVSEAKAQLILENQQAIADAKRERDNAANELERLKREQAKAIKDGVTSELNKLDTEVSQKRYQFERIEREFNELQKAKSELDAEVGVIAIHKSSINQIKSDLTSLGLKFSDAFDTNVIPVEVAGEWDAIYFALSKLKGQMGEWRDNTAPIESSVVIGELVD